MSTNKQDTLLTVDKDSRDKLKKLATKERRTMKVMLEIILEDYFKRNK